VFKMERPRSSSDTDLTARAPALPRRASGSETLPPTSSLNLAKRPLSYPGRATSEEGPASTQATKSREASFDETDYDSDAPLFIEHPDEPRTIDVEGTSRTDGASRRSEHNWAKLTSRQNGPFKRWAWVEPGKLARSGAPNYADEDDRSQNMSPSAIRVLKAEGITRVVACNGTKLPAEQIEALNREDIQYLWLSTKDFWIPAASKLIESSEFIESNPGATLVYCGYGRGRTGMVIAAWEIYAGRKTVNEAIDSSTIEREAQIEAVRSVSKRQ